MKVTKNILFRLLLLLAVLFSLGIEASSDYTTPLYNVELSAETNGVDNNASSDIDSFNDDHINQVYESCMLGERLTRLPISNGPFLPHKFSFSSWQPPKKFSFGI
ncbi:MAG TPA: hypothetical protein DCR40_10915 [Prolixibacteraceae bacterium]|nr:hypothetical protein [Prolixibacteraceae bacterium]